MDAPGLTIRTMVEGDLARAAELSEALGYPTTVHALAERHARIASDRGQAVFVAAAAQGGIVGWVHVQDRRVLEAPAYAEIAGLVVDASARRSGAGRALVDAACGWARARGLSRVVVRSNVVRPEAHGFYEAVGFARVKSQHVYERASERNRPGGAPGSPRSVEEAPD